MTNLVKGSNAEVVNSNLNLGSQGCKGRSCPPFQFQMEIQQVTCKDCVPSASYDIQNN